MLKYAFSYSEAAHRGWIPASAGTKQLWYEIGINASMTQWGVSSADAATYVASVGAASMKLLQLKNGKLYTCKVKKHGQNTED